MYGTDYVKSVGLTHTIQATPLQCQYGSEDIDGARRKKLTILTSAGVDYPRCHLACAQSPICKPMSYGVHEGIF